MCFDTLVDPRTVGMPFAPPWQCDLPMFPLIICRPAAVRSRHKQAPKAPPWLQQVVQSHESLPWRRRGFERDAVIDQLVARAKLPKEETPGDDRLEAEEAEATFPLRTDAP